MIQVTVKLFAMIADIVGNDELHLTAEEGSTPADILDNLIQQNPRLDKWRPYVRVAVNYEYVPLTHPLSDKDELAVIPPMSGG